MILPKERHNQLASLRDARGSRLAYRRRPHPAISSGQPTRQHKATPPRQGSGPRHDEFLDVAFPTTMQETSLILLA